jgi:DNA-binding PadR family transcriptional regulator
MALRYAILGSLTTRPGSGYDLARQFDTGLGWFWSAAHSQIYPELRRLEEAGLVQSTQTTVGEKLEKTVYSITPEGLEELRRWAADAPKYRPNRDPERLQFIFSDLGDTAPIRRHLEAHRDHYLDRRERLTQILEAMRTGTHARIAERMRDQSEARQALTLMLRDVAYSGDVERAQLEIDWAQRALTELDRYEAEHGAAVSAR